MVLYRAIGYFYDATIYIGNTTTVASKFKYEYLYNEKSKAVVQSSRTRKIIFTGPESTGKTTGALKLAHSQQLPLVYEYARNYLEEHGPSYTMADLYAILEAQYKAEDDAQALSEVIICDTDWLTIHIWAEEVFGKKIKPPFDLDERYYILCPPDIPWEPDPLRENPHDRDRLFDIYKEKLKFFKLDFEVLAR